MNGGKSYLADWIISLMPLRAKNPNAPAANDPGYLAYVEPYFGGGAVLFANDPEGISEVVNDIDGELMCFWDTLKDEAFVKFVRLVQAIPCSQVEYERALGNSQYWGRIERAAYFFVRNRQSRQALGKDFATLARNRTRRGMNELPAAWLSAIEGLPEVHARLKRVVILCGEALDVIRQQDGPRTLVYADPPYAHETRTATDAYEHEMTAGQHQELLTLLGNIKGRFLLSGYHSDLYDSYAKKFGWKCHEKRIDNKAGSGAEKRQMVECVWCNF